jgi:hypothetical protein
LEGQEFLLPTEKQLLDELDTITLDVLRMSQDEVAAYLEENGLSRMATPEGIDEILGVAGRVDSISNSSADEGIDIWDVETMPIIGRA